MRVVIMKMKNCQVGKDVKLMETEPHEEVQEVDSRNMVTVIPKVANM